MPGEPRRAVGVQRGDAIIGDGVVATGVHGHSHLTTELAPAVYWGGLYSSERDQWSDTQALKISLQRLGKHCVNLPEHRLA